MPALRAVPALTPAPHQWIYEFVHLWAGHSAAEFEYMYCKPCTDARIKRVHWPARRAAGQAMGNALGDAVGDAAGDAVGAATGGDSAGAPGPHV